MGEITITIASGAARGPQGRQRTVSDDFWSDPDLAGLDMQAKYATLYLLTNRHSNIIGVYRVVPRLICGELGWSQDEVSRVFADLARQDVIAWDPETGWVWVKPWWKEHHVGVAFGGKLAARALEEVKRIPGQWLSQYLQDLQTRGATVVDTLSDTPSDTVSGGVSHTPPPNSNLNHIHNEAAAPRVSARHAAAPAAAKKYRLRPSGLATWTQEDVSTAEKIEREIPHASISDAVSRITKQKRDPLPGLVLKELATVVNEKEACSVEGILDTSVGQLVRVGGIDLPVRITRLSNGYYGELEGGRGGVPHGELIRLSRAGKISPWCQLQESDAAPPEHP